jgi:hypothetical protein
MVKKVKFNKSKTYLLPLISELVNIEKQYLPYLNNTFMVDNEGKYENCIYILHDFDLSNPKFTTYEHHLINNELFVDMYDIGNQVLYVFKFPEEYLHEYNCLKNSKYSEFKDDAKELILEFWTVMYGENPNSLPFLTKVKDILFKTTKYRQKLDQSLSSRTQKIVISSEAELGDIIDIENETFDFKVLENIKTKLNKDTEMW